MLHGIAKHVKSGVEDFHSTKILLMVISIELSQSHSLSDFADFM